MVEELDIQELSISVCIPCIQEHVYLLDRCIKSIYNQTYLPFEVVISISNITGGCESIFYAQRYVEELLMQYRDRLNILITYTKQQQYAGENRNKCIKIATGDIISFIDADDIMYSNRLNTIVTIFKVYPKCMGILHLFTENNIDNAEPDQSFNTDFMSEYEFSEHIHFGHPSFRRVVYDKYQYSNSPRTQDFDFIESVLPEYLANIIIYNKQLTCYVSDDSTFFGTNEHTILLNKMLE